MTEPVYACSLTEKELAARRAEWRALDERALLRTEARPDGRLLVYRGGDGTAQILAALVDAESRCCPFLVFTIDQGGDEVRATVRFPEAAPTATRELGIVDP